MIWSSNFRTFVTLSVLVAGSFVAFCPLTFGQTPADKEVHPPASNATAANNDLATQLHILRKKVADLEATLKSQHQARYGANASDQSNAMPMSMNDSTDPLLDSAKPDAVQMGDKKMGMMKGMGGMSQNAGGKPMSGGMGMMADEMGGMKGMSGGSGGMGMGMMKGMGMMGRSSMSGMSSMSSMNMPSALPGFAGASHLYHIGETGFFLDHPQHIALNDDQQVQLNKIKEASLLSTATAERKIDEAEQELWTITAEGQPDITKIEAKAKEIAQLQVDNRIAFIQSVGKAAELLTDDQRDTLVGMAGSSAAMIDE